MIFKFIDERVRTREENREGDSFLFKVYGEG